MRLKLQDAEGPGGRVQVPAAVRGAAAQREVGRPGSEEGGRAESPQGAAKGERTSL